MEPHTWNIRNFAAPDLEGVFQLLTNSGWSHRISDHEFLERLVSASQRVIVAMAQDKVIGFGRAITDGISNGYLSMVVVAPEWRGREIGRSLVEKIVANDEEVTWILRASRSQAPEFFSKLGFTPSLDAMERTRKR